MKKILLLLSLLSVAGFGQQVISKKIKSNILGQKRELLIYEPFEVAEQSERRFEVIYVFDAQSRNFFDFVQSSIQFIKGQQQAFIVVGIVSPFNEATKQSRNTDFLPTAQHPETEAHY